MSLTMGSASALPVAAARTLALGAVTWEQSCEGGSGEHCNIRPYLKDVGCSYDPDVLCNESVDLCHMAGQGGALLDQRLNLLHGHGVILDKVHDQLKGWILL